MQLQFCRIINLTVTPAVRGPHMKIRCKLGILNVAGFLPNTFNANAIVKICLIFGKKCALLRYYQVRTDLALFHLIPLLHMVHFKKRSAWGVVCQAMKC